MRKKKACRLAGFFNNPKDGDSGKAGAPQRGGLPVRVSTTKAEGAPAFLPGLRRRGYRAKEIQQIPEKNSEYRRFR